MVSLARLKNWWIDFVVVVIIIIIIIIVVDVATVVDAVKIVVTHLLCLVAILKHIQKYRNNHCTMNLNI